MNKESYHPRIGVPYRTRDEEVKGIRGKYDKYLDAIVKAGGEPVEISLVLSNKELAALGSTLEGIVLPGSPADVNSALYGEARHPQSADADADLERTSVALLEQAFSQSLPILAICYGVQILNVYLGGSLIQDISSELQTSIQHAWIGGSQGAPEPIHGVRFESDSRLARSLGALETQINSSHHQAIRGLGRGLRVAGRASDGVIEAVEWTADSNWVTGVQWHPERMAGDRLAQALFQELIAVARGATVGS